MYWYKSHLKEMELIKIFLLSTIRYRKYFSSRHFQNADSKSKSWHEPRKFDKYLWTTNPQFFIKNHVFFIGAVIQLI